MRLIRTEKCPCFLKKLKWILCLSLFCCFSAYFLINQNQSFFISDVSTPKAGNRSLLESGNNQVLKRPTVHQGNGRRQMQRIYIIHVDHARRPTPLTSEKEWYRATLESLVVDSEPSPVLLYTYRHVLSGFSAAVTSSQVRKLKPSLRGFISAELDTPTQGQLLTTHTPEFLGLGTAGTHQYQAKKGGIWAKSRYGKGQIIGVLDSGIWPESRSFNDHGMPPVPRHWRGKCEAGSEFNSSYCNRKLIGARSFSKALKQAGISISSTDDYDSARDWRGHGTHVSSVAAGSAVECVDHFGYARGTAIGMAPKAHLAIYKISYFGDHFLASDLLAAFDQALSDGVTALSLSISNPWETDSTPFHQNPIAVGTFAAMRMGVFAACSAGNLGIHGRGTIINGAPWVTTIGAETIDRDFGGTVTVAEMDGNSPQLELTGRSIFPASIRVKRVPLFFGYGNTSQEYCLQGAIEPSTVMGKFVFCFDSEKLDIPEGAKGAIIASSTPLRTHIQFWKPLVYISRRDGMDVRDYLTKSKAAVVTVRFLVTRLDTKPAPQVAYFSSRGPYVMAPSVLKPDLVAPGLEILGARVPHRGLPYIGLGSSHLISDFMLDSGTSFSCAHVSGIAALLKSVHPNWSPAMIRSAMMTTANTRDNTNNTISDMLTGRAATPLEYGSGSINPNKAIDPGLVYDSGVEDYVNLLCAMNYTATQIKILTQRHSQADCTRPSLDLNHPAFMVILNGSKMYNFHRVVKYVGTASVVSFMANLETTKGMRVSVEPSTIVFRSGHIQTARFNVTIHLYNQLEESSGFLIWASDRGGYIVRSPITATFWPSLVSGLA